jgi:anti-sigma factor RsiW
MSRCDVPDDLLEAWADGELPGAEGRRLEAHVGGCPVCRRRLREAQALRELLREALDAPSPDLEERILASLPRGGGGDAWVRTRARHAVGGLALALAGLAAAGAVRHTAPLEFAAVLARFLDDVARVALRAPLARPLWRWGGVVALGVFGWRLGWRLERSLAGWETRR